MFYCTILQRFQDQIQQEQKDIWNSDGEDSVSLKSNASNESELSIWHQSTPVPLPQIRSRENPTDSDEVKPKSKKKKKETKRDGNNEKVPELMKKRGEVLYNSKHEKYYDENEKQKAWKWIASKLISRDFDEFEDAQINEKIMPLHTIMDRKTERKSIKS